MSPGRGNKTDMSTIKILHAADLHLDSPFEGLPAGKASVRRGEQRELLSRLAELTAREKLDLVLLSGDLLDSGNTYFETGEELIRSLGSMGVPVFIAPGNHDYYSEKSPYARLTLPENVHLFTSQQIECVELPEFGARVYGAAFTDNRSPALLEDFSAPKTDGVLNIMCIHGEFGAKDSIYDPISEEQLAASGMDYVALGHIHKASGLRRASGTWYSWPGCPEGRGFDELGEKTVNIVELSDDECSLRTVSVASRKYEILDVNVTGSDPLLAVHTQLTDETVKDVYRIILSGEVDAAPDLNRLRRSLEEFFFELQLRDNTRLKQSVWEAAGDGSLRGLFLMKLRAKYNASRDDLERERIEQAARWGLAALDNREEVVRHEDQ